MDIETLLKEYKENSAALNVLDVNIQCLNADLRELARRYKENQADEIASIALRRAPPDGIEAGKNSARVAISRTEKIALDLDSEKARLGHEIGKLRDARKELVKKVLPIREAINGLYEQERFIINLFFVESLSMYTVKSRYEREYCLPISYSSLARKKRNALEKLERILCPDLSANEK